MKLKQTCLCTFLGLGLLISTILCAIFFQQEVLQWMDNNPIRVVIVMWAVIIDSIAIVALLFKNSFFCPEADDCPYTFKGLNHSRNKNRR